MIHAILYKKPFGGVIIPQKGFKSKILIFTYNGLEPALKHRYLSWE